MKEKLFIILCALFVWCSLGHAEQISVEKAKSEAATFLFHRTKGEGGSRIPSTSSQLTLAYTAVTQSQQSHADYYVFNRGQQGGYVVVAGDDRVPAILGYADVGTFSYDHVPDNMKAFLGEYVRQIEYVRSHPSMENNTKVDSYATSVSPLLKNITWNQTEPYNLYCPNDYPTGCVATAMGQVMYYHRYPDHGIGSKTYQWNGQSLTANFGATTYQWDKMQDKLTANSPSSAQSAVATLLYHVGVSVGMNYGPASQGGSGASPSYIAPALVKFFGYDKGCHLRSREYFSKSDWEATVRNELDHGRPILYGGYTVSASGHSFVCDGYNQQGYYHINWGWDGINNGYFLLTALDPKSKGVGGGAEGEGYNYNQTMVIGIQRPVEGSQPVYSLVFKYVDNATMTVKRHDAATLKANGIHTDGIDPLNVSLRFEVYDDSHRLVATSETSSQNLPMGEAIKYQGSITLPDSLKDGIYEARLAAHIQDIDEDGIFNLINYMVGENGYYEVTVKDGQVTYTPKGLPALSLESLSVTPNPIVSKKPFTVSATIKNAGGEFDGKLAYALLHPDGQKDSYYAPDRAVNIKAGETVTVNFTDSTELLGNDNYQLQLVVRDGVAHNNLGQPITIRVDGEKEKANVVGVDYVDITTGVDNAKRDSLNVLAYLHNTGGDFSGKITCLVFNNANDLDNPVCSLDTISVAIAKGEYKTVEIPGKFLDAKDKQSYYACLFNVDDNDFINPIKYAGVNFTIRDDASNEQPRLYLKRKIDLGESNQQSADDLLVLTTIQNTGGPYKGTIKASFYNINGWTPLETLSQTVTIGYGETVTIAIKGSSTQLKAGKSYDVGVTFDDADETEWKSYSHHSDYSNGRVAIVSSTGISNIPQDAATTAEIYSMSGILVRRATPSTLANAMSSLPRGEYIIRYQGRGKAQTQKIIKAGSIH